MARTNNILPCECGGTKAYGAFACRECSLKNKRENPKKDGLTYEDRIMMKNIRPEMLVRRVGGETGIRSVNSCMTGGA